MAAGTPFTGKSMTFKTGGTPTEVDHTGKWELTIGGASAKYATNSTGGWRKTTVGVGEWSGTVTVMLHAGGAQLGNRAPTWRAGKVTLFQCARDTKNT